MDFGNVESQLESVERDVENTLQRKEELQAREFRLKDAISQLKEDVEVSLSVSEHTKELGEEQQSIGQELDAYRDRVRQIEGELQGLIEQISETQDILSVLAQFGENVEAGLSILEERQRIIDECTAHLQTVIERLNMAASEIAVGSSSAMQLDKSEAMQSDSPVGMLQKKSTLAAQLDADLFDSTTFGSNIDLVQDRLSSERYFSRGNHYDGYLDFWESGNYTYSPKDNPKLVYVRARDIEGVYLWDNERDNPERFWTRSGKDGWSRENIIRKASCIETVRQKLDAGMSLELLSNRPELRDTIGSYFIKPIEVAQVGDFYVFQSDGRHRTIAAQTLDIYIPVLITGSYFREN